MLFNLYVSDLQDNFLVNVYTDDTTICASCCPNDLPDQKTEDLNRALNTLKSWSAYSHLTLSLTLPRPRHMALSSRQMSRVHPLGQFKPSLKISNRSLKCVNLTKFLDRNSLE